MKQVNSYRTFEESQEEYYRNHPEEIEGYLAIAFGEYEKDHCALALLSQLRMIARAKGLTQLVEETDFQYESMKHNIFDQKHPKFESVIAIMNALGFCLIPKKLDANGKNKEQNTLIQVS